MDKKSFDIVLDEIRKVSSVFFLNSYVRFKFSLWKFWICGFCDVVCPD